MMDDNAVSNVLGAVLVTALFFTFMTTVEVEYRPVWDETEEANHLVEVVAQFADFKSEIEKQTENRTLSPVTNPIRLSPPPGTGLLGTTATQGNLAMESSTIKTTFTTPRLIVVEKDGKPLGVLNEDWTLAGTTSEVDEIDRLDSLRLRISKNPDEDKFEFEKGMFVRMDILDANGIPAGAFKAYIPDKDKHDIWVRVEAASGEVLVDQEIASDVKYKEHSVFWIDALDPSLPFQQVLDAAEPPYDIELTYDWNSNDPKHIHTVEYSTAYVTKSNQGQDVFVGSGGGSTANNYQDVHKGGRIAYQIDYAHLPPTKLVVEHGAVIISQPEGSSMILEPHFLVERSGSMTLININIPVLRGYSDAAAGRETINVVTQATRQASVLGTLPEFSFRIDTEFPDVWRDFLQERMTDAGYNTPAHYTMTVNDDHVIIDVSGTSTVSSIEDVQVRTEYGFVTVSLA